MAASLIKAPAQLPQNPRPKKRYAALLRKGPLSYTYIWAPEESFNLLIFIHNGGSVSHEKETYALDSLDLSKPSLTRTQVAGRLLMTAMKKM